MTKEEFSKLEDEKLFWMFAAHALTGIISANREGDAAQIAKKAFFYAEGMIDVANENYVI